MTKIKVTQLAFGDVLPPNGYFRYTEEINHLYCQYHGYEYVVEKLATHNQDVRNRHPHWEKIGHMRRHLHDCDFLLFVDTDAIFYSFVLSVEEEIVSMLPSDAHFLMAADTVEESGRVNPHDSNSGVILCRNTRRMHAILEEWDDCTDYISEFDDTRHKWPVEQEAGNRIMRKYHHDYKHVWNYYKMNAVMGQFIRHFMGMKHHEKMRCIREFYDSPLMKRNRELVQLSQLSK